jgi:hypothetical protein
MRSKSKKENYMIGMKKRDREKILKTESKLIEKNSLKRRKKENKNLRKSDKKRSWIIFSLKTN